MIKPKEDVVVNYLSAKISNIELEGNGTVIEITPIWYLIKYENFIFQVYGTDDSIWHISPSYGLSFPDKTSAFLALGIDPIQLG